MATYNGIAWLPEQVASILSQAGVSVRLIVSDDASTDGTRDWLHRLAQQDPRLELLPASPRFGYAGANFYRLLSDADLSGVQYVAFADQDDIWLAGKLERAISLLSAGADAVSSDVTAFWPDGKEKLICKSQAQTRHDYLFEAGGPGCTYVFPAASALELRAMLEAPESVAHTIIHHDWFCYAALRALGRRWVIDSVPSLRYRQHQKNEVGANTGWRAAFGRRRKVASGWYRREVDKICRLALQLRHGDAELLAIRERVVRGGFFDRVAMMACAPQFRRSLRDRMALAAMFATGIFWWHAGGCEESR